MLDIGGGRGASAWRGRSGTENLAHRTEWTSVSSGRSGFPISPATLRYFNCPGRDIRPVRRAKKCGCRICGEPDPRWASRRRAVPTRFSRARRRRGRQLANRVTAFGAGGWKRALDTAFPPSATASPQPPEIAVGLSDVGRDYSLGYRLTPGGVALELALEARRLESASRRNAPSEHAATFRVTSRF